MNTHGEETSSASAISDTSETPAATPARKFDLLLDLGVITVPESYNHSTWLSKFFEKNRRKFNYTHNSITDKKFSRPSRIMLPGEKFQVRAFGQVGTGMSTSEERLEFLASKKALLTGPQGLALVFEQKSDNLLKGKHYSLLDEGKNLYVDSSRSPQVPRIFVGRGGGFMFDLHDFIADWYGGDAMICLMK